MNRDQLIRAIQKLARKRKQNFLLETNRGKGSHYTVTYGSKRTTVQSDLNPGRIRRILKQLDIDPADI